MDQIKIGVGVIIWRDGKLLIGKRLSKHGHDNWSFPGGHVEYGESPEDAAMREVAEETNLKLTDLSKYHFTNDVYPNGTQYITLFFEAEKFDGKLENLEPEKCAGWLWCEPDQLPEPLFIPIRTLITEKGALYQV
jgi:8-oxo-dGTP diphosphatase